MASCSGQLLAILFGDISPKISTTMVTTMVESVAPISPNFRVNSTVPTEAMAIFTMLLPIRIVEINLLYCSSSLQTSAAFLLPFSASVFSFVVFMAEKAVSVAEKKLDSIRQTTIMVRYVPIIKYNSPFLYTLLKYARVLNDNII